MTVVTYSTMTGRTARVDVPAHVAAEWERICAQSSRLNPVDWCGRRLRPYPALDVASHAPYAPAGIYVDHRDPVVERSAYEQRDRLARLANGERQAVLQGIADAHGLRHWRDAYNTVRNVGRRVTGESGRNASGDLVWRRWSTGWSRQAQRETAVVAAASGSRRFGVEIEFNHNGRDLHGDRDRIVAAARHQGMSGHARWGSHYRAPELSGWQFMYDCTVSGGEIVSDIMAGDTASLDEVRDMLAIVRQHGGRPGPEQGMHVHHDVSDFSRADKLRLIDNLQAIQAAVTSVLPRSRQGNSWAQPMSDWEFASARESVAANRPVHVGRYFMFNLSHLMGNSARVEWRALGNTLNGTKHRCWIRLGQAVSAATKAGVVFDDGIVLPELLRVLRAHGLTRFAEQHLLGRAGLRQPVAA